MVRISDILKKAEEKKEEKEKPAIKPSQQGEAIFLHELQLPKLATPAPPAQISEIMISPVVMKQTKAVSSQESIKLYEETVSLIREILKEDIDYKSIDMKKISARVEEMIDQLRLGNGNLLMLALINDSTDENYLFCHSLNTCIYALEAALGLGYERAKLIDLGISVLLHDIGIMKYLDLVNQSRSLTAAEYDKVKTHPAAGAQILKDIQGINKIHIEVAQQHHERIDGSGYPRNLKKGAINEYAQIIGLVDVYEAMTHPRSYRDRYLPVETIQEILAHKNTFEYKLIKILIERIGIFPIGSLVELNTREIARVVKLNPKVCLRPVVEIIYSANGEELKETKTLDLSVQVSIYIKGQIRKSELESKLTAAYLLTH